MWALLRSAIERVRWLLFASRESREMAEEFAYHIEQLTAKYQRQGMTPREARRRAHLAFGREDRWVQDCREEVGVAVAERWIRELSLAFRRFRREPTLTVSAVVTLGLGLGTATAVFALADSVLLRPLPYLDSDELVHVSHDTDRAGLARAGHTPGTHAHYREGSRTFDALSLYFENALSVSVTDGDRAERIRAAMVDRDFFGVLGVPAAVGRTFHPEDLNLPPDSVGPVVISHALWRRRYSSDPGIVGRSVELNRRPRPVVGVMPAGFSYPHHETDVWYLHEPTPTVGDVPRDLVLSAIGRLADGVSAEIAEADLSNLLTRLESSPLLTDGSVRPRVIPLKAQLVDPVRMPLVALVITALLIVVVTVSNVVGLFLVRSQRRRGELALSRALGASDADVRRRLLSEGFLLALFGGCVGVALAWIAISVRFGFSLTDIPRLHELTLDVRSLLFASATSAAIALVVTAATWIRSRGGSMLDRSPAAAGSGLGKAAPFCSVLQIGLSTALLIATALVAETVMAVSRLDPGFEVSEVITLRVNPSGELYRAPSAAVEFHRRLRSEILSIPEVVQAEMVAWLPLSGAPQFARVNVSAPDEVGYADLPPATMNLVSPGYFSLMGIGVLEGVGFDSADLSNPESLPVVISESLARGIRGGGESVGVQLTLPGYARYIDAPTFTVIGVVNDVTEGSLSDGAAPTLYFPAAFDPPSNPSASYPLVPRAMSVVVGTRGASEAILPDLQEAVQRVDPKVAVTDVMTLGGLVQAASGRIRLVSVLLSIAALMSVCLGATGVYGIVAYQAGQRTREIGIRIALGATSGEVIRTVMADAHRLGWLGLSLGFVLSLGLVGALRSQLYPMDHNLVLSFIGPAAGLLVVVLFAAWLPARRAAKLEATQALKSS